MSETAYATAEHGRLLSAMIMIGTIAQLDEANARATVDVDDLTTDWLPWATRRAGPDAEWWAPEPGEQVIVLSPYGDPSQAVIVMSLYQDSYPAPANVKTQWRKKFADGTTITYDRDAHALTVDVGAGSVTVNCATATIKATESVTLDAPSTKITGSLEVDGSTSVKEITSNGKDISSTHKHTSASPGDPTSPPL